MHKRLLQELEGLRTWRPTQREKPPTWFQLIRADAFRSGCSSGEGAGSRAWISPLPHGRIDGAMDERMGCSPPRRHSCTRPRKFFGCHPQGRTQQSHIFRRHVCFWFSGSLGICKTYSLSYTAIIISIDGFSVPPSISFPNYTVERSAVANNQINEFGYLDSIIASPLPLQHTQ